METDFLSGTVPDIYHRMALIFSSKSYQILLFIRLSLRGLNPSRVTEVRLEMREGCTQIIILRK